MLGLVIEFVFNYSFRQRISYDYVCPQVELFIHKSCELLDLERGYRKLGELLSKWHPWLFYLIFSVFVIMYILQQNSQQKLVMEKYSSIHVIARRWTSGLNAYISTQNMLQIKLYTYIFQIISIIREYKKLKLIAIEQYSIIEVWVYLCVTNHTKLQ